VSSPAIVGLGMTPMSVAAGSTPSELGRQALLLALADAGMARCDLDGLIVSSSQGLHPDLLGVALARSCGLGDLRMLEHLEIKGATPAAMVQLAISAMNAGMVGAVACVFGDAPLHPGSPSGAHYAHSGGVRGLRGLERASGALGSVPTFALMAARYFERSGNNEEDL
jgi:acetyl-CoA acetyltransferase